MILDESERTSFVKEPSILEQKAYRDTWGVGSSHIVAWFHECADSTARTLADTGAFTFTLTGMSFTIVKACS